MACLPSASSPCGCRVPGHRPERLLSTTPGSTHSQPWADLSWPDPAERLGKRKGRSHYFLTTAAPPPFTSPQREGRKETKGNQEVAALPTLQPPASPPAPAAHPELSAQPRDKREEAQEGDRVCAGGGICIMNGQGCWLGHVFEGLTVISFSLRRACHSNSAGHL